LNTEIVMCTLTEHVNLKIVDVKMVPKNIIGRTAAALRADPGFCGACSL